MSLDYAIYLSGQEDRRKKYAEFMNYMVETILEDRFDHEDNKYQAIDAYLEAVSYETYVDIKSTYDLGALNLILTQDLYRKANEPDQLISVAAFFQSFFENVQMINLNKEELEAETREAFGKNPSENEDVFSFYNIADNPYLTHFEMTGIGTYNSNDKASQQAYYKDLKQRSEDRLAFRKENYKELYNNGLVKLLDFHIKMLKNEINISDNSNCESRVVEDLSYSNYTWPKEIDTKAQALSLAYFALDGDDKAVGEQIADQRISKPHFIDIIETANDIVNTWSKAPKRTKSVMIITQEAMAIHMAKGDAGLNNLLKHLDLGITNKRTSINITNKKNKGK